MCDASKIAEVWRKTDEVWWPGGPTDPNVCLPDGLFAIRALQAPNGKVTLSHLLEMLDGRVIDGSTAEGFEPRTSA